MVTQMQARRAMVPVRSPMVLPHCSAMHSAASPATSCIPPATFHGTGLEHFHSAQCLKRDQFFIGSHLRMGPSAHPGCFPGNSMSWSSTRPSPAPTDRQPGPYIAFAHLGVVT
jgi:hypothetical protein